MTALGPEPHGATPLDDEDLEGLIPEHVTNRGELMFTGMEVNSPHQRHETLPRGLPLVRGARSAPDRSTRMRRRMRLATVLVVFLVALTTSCTETQHLDGASSCVDFIHSDMAKRSEAVAAAAANARFVPSDAATPDVADVSMMCDAFPDITVAQAMGRVVERS